MKYKVTLNGRNAAFFACFRASFIYFSSLLTFLYSLSCLLFYNGFIKNNYYFFFTKLDLTAYFLSLL